MPTHLNDGLIYGEAAIESGPASHNTVSAKHPGFDHEAVGKRDNKRDNSISGKVDSVDLFLCSEENCTLAERLSSQMRPKQFTVFGRQRCQK
jgi:hypothetical protein